MQLLVRFPLPQCNCLLLPMLLVSRYFLVLGIAWDGIGVNEVAHKNRELEENGKSRKSSACCHTFCENIGPAQCCVPHRSQFCSLLVAAGLTRISTTIVTGFTTMATVLEL